ncbi:MAG: RraA family protein [Firmicutes bacterium]|nr:RraA family protein [Bacillota bacterium]
MEEILQAFQKHSTSTISDALDRLGIPGQALGIRPLKETFRLVGRAFTAHYVPVGAEKGTVGDYIDDVEPGQVVVLDNDGRLDATVWGDILTTVAYKRGIAGTVINGVCRDYNRSVELDYPIFACAHTMRTGKDRVQISAFNIPVSLGPARVAPGDILVGDADGIVVVPRQAEAEVLRVANEIAEAEDRIREAVEQGMRLDEARVKYRYFQLQRKADQ